ncbi:MAG: hypothetical protein ACMUIG_01605 [Thermoplasmatota archaeon]
MKAAPSLVIAVTALMLILPVSAVDHHINYDTAERNIDLIRYYIDHILEELNLTLGSMHSRNASGAAAHSSNFTDLIARAGRTLLNIPPEVDSYAELSRDLDALNRTGMQLKNLTDSYLDIEGALTVFTTYRFDFGNGTSFIENVTRVSGSFADFDSALSSFPTYSTLLLRELDLMAAKGYDLEGQISMVSNLDDLLSDLSAGRIDEGSVLMDLMIHPMNQWDISLADLLNQTEPNSTLESDAQLLGAAGSLVIAVLSTTLSTASASLEVIRDSVLGFHENQTGFLDLVKKLEDDDIELNLTAETEMMDATSTMLDDMYGLLMIMMDHYEILKTYDNGSVRMKLDELLKLLDGYSGRWTKLNVRMNEFRTLCVLLEQLILSNIIDHDPDGSGRIELQEIRDIKWNATSYDLVDRIRDVNDQIRGQLDSISDVFRPDLLLIYRPLERISDSAVDLTLSHGSFIENIRAIDYETDDLAPFVFNYIDAFTGLLDMISVYNSLYPMINETSNSSFSVNGENLVIIGGMIESYTDLMEEIGLLFNRSFLALKLNSEVVSYDSTVTITSILFQPDAAGGIGFRDGDNVLISFDWGLDLNLTTRRGLASESIVIPRNVTVGVHLVNGSSPISENETLYRNITISVRRISTILTLSTEIRRVDMGQTVDLALELIDEFGRDVSGIVLLNGREIHVNGSAVLEFLPDSFGDYPVTAYYNGSRIYSDSRSSILLNVSLDSIISVLLNGATFYVGDDINVSISLDYGKGNAALFMDGDVILESFMESPGFSNITLNSTDIGIGYYRISAYIESTVPWARNGWSRPVYILIMEQPEDAVEDNDTITDPIEDIDPPPNDGDDGSDDGYDLKWQIAVGALLVLLFALVLISAAVWTRRNTRKLEADIPVAKKRRRTVKTEVQDEEIPVIVSSVRKTDEGSYEAVFTVDPSRADIIRHYLDLVDNAPADLDIDRTKTPREVGSAMIGHGADMESVNGVTTDFERAVYSGSEPSKEEASVFGRRISSLRNWFRSGFNTGSRPPV